MYFALQVCVVNPWTVNELVATNRHSTGWSKVSDKYPNYLEAASRTLTRACFPVLAPIIAQFQSRDFAPGGRKSKFGAMNTEEVVHTHTQKPGDPHIIHV